MKPLNELTDEELRIEIAGLVGWRIWNTVWTDQGGVMVQGWSPEMYAAKQKAITIPNYPGCLNACHEVEETLTDDQWINYIEALKTLLKAHDNTYRSVKAKVNASPRIRSEAFVMAMRS